MAVNQGDGLRASDRKKKKVDRTRKVLNYPGLVYFDEKNKQKFIRTINGVGPDANGNVNVEGGTGGGGSTTFNGTYVETVNGESGTVTVTPAKIGAVPTTRTVNGKSLRKNIVLSASDILVSGSGQTVYEALQGLGSDDGPYWVVTIRPQDWTINQASKMQYDAALVADHSSNPIKREITVEEYRRQTGELVIVEDEDGNQLDSFEIELVKEYDVAWHLDCAIADEPLGVAYPLLWCNTGDIPVYPGTLMGDINSSENKRFSKMFVNQIVHAPNGYQHSTASHVALYMNARRRIYEDSDGNFVYFDDTDEPPVFPTKTIYLVFDKANPIIYDSEDFDPDLATGYPTYCDRGTGPTGTPLQNGIDTSNGKSLLVPVWSNESPDSAFPAQTVTCDLSQFSFAAVEYRQWNDGSANDANQLVVGMIGTDVNMPIVSGFASNNVGRRVATLSPDGVTFSYIGYDAKIGSNSTRNRYCVPIRIYGVNVEKKGDKGDQGPAGETGERGDKGETGAKGAPFTFEDFTQEQLDALTEGIAGAAEAETAKKLSTARQIALTGEASGQALFDGSEDVSIYTHVERITNTELEEMLT